MFGKLHKLYAFFHIVSKYDDSCIQLQYTGHTLRVLFYNILSNTFLKDTFAFVYENFNNNNMAPIYWKHQNPLTVACRWEIRNFRSCYDISFVFYDIILFEEFNPIDSLQQITRYNSTKIQRKLQFMIAAVQKWNTKKLTICCTKCRYFFGIKMKTIKKSIFFFSILRS